MSRNIPLFIAFRVFFNARFYYPVLGVLFLDLGLSLEQYAILNVIWAATILLLEIPSGALADVIGRRWMVILAGALMVLEMAVFAFAPVGEWLFPLLVFNRILSGVAQMRRWPTTRSPSKGVRKSGVRFLRTSSGGHRALFSLP